MATKIYEDATTKELVIVRGTLESRYAASSDLSRTNDDNSKLSVNHSNNESSVLDPIVFSNLQNEAGAAYASFAELKNSLDGYFSFEATNYEDIVLPSGMNIAMPFTIETSGSLYKISDDFDIKERANIAVSKTYFVDSVLGDDSNNGTSEATPFKTLTRVESNADADRIYVKRGSYFHKNERPISITRSVEVIAYGEGDKPVISADTSNQFGTFSQTDNYYSATAVDYVGRLIDTSVLDSDGQPRPYTMAASISDVNSTQGSFFWVGNVIYVRTFDDRTPDSALIYLDNLAYRTRLDNTTQYFENIEFFSSVQLQNNTGAGGSKSYFLNCNLTYGGHQVLGQDEAIFQNCKIISLSGDAMNIDDRNSLVSNVYEISSFFSNYKNGQTNSQGSTLHAGSNALSINSTYTKTAGQCIGDTGTGQRYILGCSLGDSSTGVSLATQNNCFIEGSFLNKDLISIDISSTGTVKYKNNAMDGGVNNLGTYTAY